MSTVLQKYFPGVVGGTDASARAIGAIDAPRTRPDFSARKTKARFSRKKMRFARAHCDAASRAAVRAQRVEGTGTAAEKKFGDGCGSGPSRGPIWQKCAEFFDVQGCASAAEGRIPRRGGRA
jgi:hypothetical protein